MFTLYGALQEALQAKGTLYAGALYRQVVESLKKDPAPLDNYLRERKAVAFVGFNVLNDVEHALMEEIQRTGKGLFYWDYDTFYTQDEASEAGTFMRQNLQDFPCALPQELFSNMMRLQDVTFISSNTDNATAQCGGPVQRVAPASRIACIARRGGRGERDHGIPLGRHSCVQSHHGTDQSADRWL